MSGTFPFLTADGEGTSFPGNLLPETRLGVEAESTAFRKGYI